MARAKLDLKGFEKYLEQIKEAGKEIEAATDRALRAGAGVYKAGMLRRVPKDTRNLQNHIKTKGPVHDGTFFYIEVGLIYDRNYTDAETARYGNAQEYGSSSMAAQPFIRPTLDEDKRQADAAIRKAFGRMLDQT